MAIGVVQVQEEEQKPPKGGFLFFVGILLYPGVKGCGYIES